MSQLVTTLSSHFMHPCSSYDIVNKKASIRWHHSAPPISISASVHFTRASVLWYTMEANSRYSVYKIAQ